MKYYLILITLYIFLATTHAQTYYLKAPLAGVTYSFSNASNWTSACGSGTNMIGSPQSVHDLIIDANCLPVGTISLNISGSQVCKSIRFTNTTVGKNVVLVGSVGTNFTIYGEFNNAFAANLSNEFYGNFIFTSASTATINNVFNGLKLKGIVAVDKPVTGNTVTNFDALDFSLLQPVATQFVSNPGNSGLVNCNGAITMNPLGHPLNAIVSLTGTLNLNAPVQTNILIYGSEGANRSTCNINANSTIYYAITPVKISGLTFSLPASFNVSLTNSIGGHLNAIGNTHHWESVAIINSYNAGFNALTSHSVNINITNSRIYVTSWKVSSTNVILNTNNNQLVFKGYLGSNSSLTGFSGGDKLYHFVKFTNDLKFIIQDKNKIDSLIIDEDAEVNLLGSSSQTINAGGALIIEKGASFSSVSGNTISILPTGTLNLNGTCYKPVSINGASTNAIVASNNAVFGMSASSTIISSYANITQFNINGIGLPYNAGVGSNLQGNALSSTGWSITPIAPRTLFWVGPTTATASPSNDWTNPNNWQQLTPSIVSAPNCPPTFQDSVVLSLNAYVNMDTKHAQCKTIQWLGAGTITNSLVTKNSDYGKLDVFGSFLSNASVNFNYDGDIYFRAWQSYPIITTGNKPFKRMVFFWATNVNGSWLVQNDSLICPFDYTSNNFGANISPAFTIPASNYLYSLNLKAGNLKLDNNVSIRATNFFVGERFIGGEENLPSYGNLAKTRIFSANNNNNTLILSGPGINGDVLPTLLISPNFSNTPITYTIGNSSGSALSVSYAKNTSTLTNTTINSLFSTIKFNCKIIDSVFIFNKVQYRPCAVFGGFNWYNVETDINTYPKLYLANDNFNRITCQNGVHLYNTKTTSGLIHRLITNNVQQVGYISQWTGVTGCFYTIDSASYKGDFIFNTDNLHNQRMILNAGHRYDLTTSTQSISNTGYIEANGSCTGQIKIDNGSFFNNSSYTQTVTNCAISNNTTSISSFLANLSLNLGSNMGWTYPSTPIARKLYWWDGIAGNSRGDWSNPLHWSLNSGTLTPIGGNCPPTPIDDVVFDNGSFSGVDTIVCSASSGISYANCHSMYWKNTIPVVIKGDYNNLSDSTNFKLDIYGSILTNSFIVNNSPVTQFKGLITFRGNSGTNPDTINTTGYSFNRKVVFEADAPTTKNWQLASNLTALYPYSAEYDANLFFLAGSLHTNNYKLTIDRYQSVSTKYRKLSLANTLIEIKSINLGSIAYSWLVGGNTSLFNIDAGTSKLFFNSKIGNTSKFVGGGGKKYYNLEFAHNAEIIRTNKDTIHKIIFNGPNAKIGASTNNNVKNGGDSLMIDSLIASNVSATANYISLGINNTIGTALYNRNSTLRYSTFYKNLFHLEPTKTYQFGYNETQYLANACKGEIIGNAGAGNQITLNSTQTNTQAYIRKDSGIVCTDFVYMRDIWTIGNGLSSQDVTCNLPTCDTLRESSVDGAGPPGTFTCANNYAYNQMATSGRARFQAGTNANFQGNDKGWESCTYSVLPKVEIAAGSPTICLGDSVKISFVLEGNPPYQNLTYIQNNNSLGGFPAINNATMSITGNILSGGISPSYSVSPGLNNSDVLAPTNPSLSISTFGSASNPYIYSFWLKPTQTTQYSLPSVSVDRCFNNLSLLGVSAFQINISALPTNLAITSVSTICTGAAPITFTGSSTTGVTYTLFTSPTTTTVGITMNSYSVSASAYNATVTLPATNFTTTTTATTYTYYMASTSSFGCLSSGRQPIIITATPLPTISIASQQNVLCFGGSTGSVTLTATGGTGTNTISPTTTSGLLAGNYSYTITDNVGCTNTKTLSVAQPSALPAITIASQQDVLCFGGNTGSVTLTSTGGTGASTITPSITSGLLAGNYSYTITDNAGCTNTKTLSIMQPTASLNSVVAEVSPNANCVSPNGIATVTVNGGSPSYTINWNTGAIGTTASNLNTGGNTYNITDANGCLATGSINLTGVSGIFTSAISQNSVTCFGVSNANTTYTTSGGGVINYTLTNLGTNANTINTTGLFTGLAAGNYSLYVIGTGGCTDTDFFSIAQPSSSLSVASIATQSVSCFGAIATLTLNAIGGTTPYTYNWQAPSVSTNSLSTYLAGTYTANVTDANNCASSIQTVSINQPLSAVTFTAISTTQAGCGLANGTATLLVSGGWGTAYSYSVNNTAIASNVATNLSAGTYSATVVDINGCSSNTLITITNPITPIISLAVASNSICYGNTVSISPTGATNYTVGSIAFTNSIALTPTASTVYNVQGTDNNNCVSLPIAYTITVFDLPIINPINTITSCTENNTGGAEITVINASTSYTATWSNGTNGLILQNVAAGIYTVNVLNSFGCANNQSITIPSQDCLKDVFIPQLVTPNGDGNNDFFVITNIEQYPNNTVSIFNRWGNLVYSKKGYDNMWNGTPNVSNASGKGTLPAATYFIILDFGDNGKTKNYNGFVQLDY